MVGGLQHRILPIGSGDSPATLQRLAPAGEDIVIAAIRHGIVIGDFLGGWDVAQRHERVGATDAAIGIAGMVDAVRGSRRVRDEKLVLANLRAIPVPRLTPIQIDFRCGRDESIPNGDDFTSPYLHG